MKSVMISIKPKWCELIASGKKTVEVRKTRPKIEAPFKCYIYETKDKTKQYYDVFHKNTIGKVIGEFVCDIIFSISVTYSDPNSCVALKEFPYTCLTDKQIIDYLGNGKQGYGWHISDLVVYDNPKELSEFCKEDFDEALSNWEDLFSIGVPTGCVVKYPPEPKKEDYILTRPFQSWGYVEEIEE